MSADARYRKLESKVAALEAAGQGNSQEANLARAAMAEVRPLVGSLPGLVGTQDGKVAESAPVVTTASPPEGETPKTTRVRKAKPEGAVTE